MSLIQDCLNKIKNAVFGEEVRQSIIDSINQCYKDATGHPESVASVINEIENVKQEQAELSSEIDEKAKQSDLEMQKDRIDNLATLKEGSTTGDAELIDGRVGEDGVTYENIGEAIRNQFNKINQQFLKEDVDFTVTGYYLNIEGKNTVANGWATTDFIQVTKGDIVQVTVKGYNSNVSAIYFYDNSKNNVKSLVTSDSIEQTYTVVIEQDGYIKCSGKEIDTLKGTISRLNPQLYNNYKEYINNFSLEIKLNWQTGGYIFHADGTLKADEAYIYTDYIDICDLEGLYVYVTEYFDYAAGIAFYDANKNYIGGIGTEGGSNVNLGRIIEIKLKGHYMRLSCKNSILEKMFKLYTSVRQVVKSFTEKQELNPCFYSENLNLIKMFNKIICIGDSYTQGAIQYKTSDGESLQSIDSKYSYPTQLSKIANVETVNLGHAGYTISQWYDKYENTTLSGYDCAIIFLGINDWYKNNNTFDSSSYVNIINKVHNENKNIPIFCVTIPKNYLSTAYTFNDTIKEVANENNCYIIDLGEYSDFNVGSDYLNGSHPNSYGYYHIAEMINSYINYIIDNNKSDFYNISFVGTDKIDF